MPPKVFFSFADIATSPCGLAPVSLYAETSCGPLIFGQDFYPGAPSPQYADLRTMQRISQADADAGTEVDACGDFRFGFFGSAQRLYTSIFNEYLLGHPPYLTTRTVGLIVDTDYTGGGSPVAHAGLIRLFRAKWVEAKTHPYRSSSLNLGWTISHDGRDLSWAGAFPQTGEPVSWLVAAWRGDWE